MKKVSKEEIQKLKEGTKFIIYNPLTDNQLPERAQVHVHRVSDAIQPSHPQSLIA